MAEINSFHQRNRQQAEFCPFFLEKEIVSFQQRQYDCFFVFFCKLTLNYLKKKKTIRARDCLETFSFFRNEILTHQSAESGLLFGRVACPKRMRLKPVLFASAATTVLFYFFLNWPVKLLPLPLFMRLYFNFI